MVLASVFFEIVDKLKINFVVIIVICIKNDGLLTVILYVGIFIHCCPSRLERGWALKLEKDFTGKVGFGWIYPPWV